MQPVWQVVERNGLPSCRVCSLPLVCRRIARRRRRQRYPRGSTVPPWTRTTRPVPVRPVRPSPRFTTRRVGSFVETQGDAGLGGFAGSLAGRCRLTHRQPLLTETCHLPRNDYSSRRPVCGKLESAVSSAAVCHDRPSLPLPPRQLPASLMNFFHLLLLLLFLLLDCAAPRRVFGAFKRSG